MGKHVMSMRRSGGVDEEIPHHGRSCLRALGADQSEEQENMANVMQIMKKRCC